jgi:hypothetical protein
MMWRRTLLALTFGLASTMAVAPVARAQQPDTSQPVIGGGGRRPLLERAIRQRWIAVVRNRLALTDAQVDRLLETNRHFSAQRQALNHDERGIRQEVRAQLTGAVPADDKRLATLIDSLLDIQRQRVVVTQAEQKELATYLSPVQRVKLLALQEQLRTRLEQIRAARRGARLDESEF